MISALDMVKRGANIDSTDFDGNTPLSLAVKSGHDRFIVALIFSYVFQILYCLTPTQIFYLKH